MLEWFRREIKEQLPFARFELYKWVSVVTFGLLVAAFVRAYSFVRAINDRYFYGALFAICCLAFYLTTRAVSAVGNNLRQPKGKPEDQPLRKLTIHSAVYGTGPVNDLDVTEQLESAIREALVIPVDNNFLGCDPAPNQVKRLFVEYSYGNRVRLTVAAPEHSRLVLPEDSQISQLKEALDTVKSAARSANEALRLLQENSANNEKRHQKELATLKAEIEEDAKPEIKAYLEEFTYGLTYSAAQTHLFLFCQVVARNKTTSILGIKGKICTQDGSELVCQFMDDLSAWYYEPESDREELENLSLWKKLRQSPLTEEVKQIGWVGLTIAGSFNAEKIAAFKSVTLTFIDAGEREHEHSFAPPWPGNAQHLIVSKAVRR